MGLESMFNFSRERRPLAPMEARRTQAISALRRDMLAHEPTATVTINLYCEGKEVACITQSQQHLARALETATGKASIESGLNKNFDSYQIEK